MVDSEINRDKLFQQDPILRLLALKSGWTNTRIILIMSLLPGLILLMGGYIAVTTYRGTKVITGIDTTIPLIILWMFFFSPIIWGFCLWQARTFPTIFIKLFEKGVFGEQNVAGWQSANKEVNDILSRLNHPLIFLVALLFLVGFWSNRFYLQADIFLDENEYWFEVKWYLPIYVVSWSISIYVLYIAIIRHIVFVADISYFFRRVNIQVNPLDPDGVGGLDAIGSFIKWTLVFIIGYGFLAAIFILTTYLRGGDILVRADTLSFFVLYVVLTPFFLFVPITSVKNAMLRARSKILLPISKEFQKALEEFQITKQNDPEELKKINEKLKQLQEYREIIIKSFPTLPIAEGVVKVFRLLATIPYLSSIMPLVIDFLIQS